MEEKLIVPCCLDPVKRICSTKCPNFTFALNTLLGLSKKYGISPQEMSEKIRNQGEKARFDNVLVSSQVLSRRVINRCELKDEIVQIEII